MAYPSTPNERRRRLTHRAVPALLVVAVGAMGIGLAIGSGRDSEAERSAKQFAAAWNREDYRSMHALLDEESRRRYPLAAFRRAYEQAAGTATATAARVGEPRGAGGGRQRIPVVVATGVFGEVRGAGHPARRRRRGGLVSRAGLPGPGEGRAADPPDPGAAAGHDRVGGRQGAGRGPRERALVTGGRGLLDRRHGRAQRRPRRPGRRLRPRLPARHAGGHQRPGAGAAGPGRGLPGRHAAGRAHGGGPGQGPPRSARAGHDRQPPAGSGRGGPGRPPRRHRGPGPQDGRGARPGRHRLLGAPAARVHVQGHHHRRRAREEQGQGGRPASRSRPRP